MGEVIGAKHGFNNGISVLGVAGFGGRGCQEAERVGIKAVELLVIAEAIDYRLCTRDALWIVFIRKLSY